MTTITRNEDGMFVFLSRADLVKIHQALSTELDVLFKQDGVLEELEQEIGRTQQLLWEVLDALGIGVLNEN